MSENCAFLLVSGRKSCLKEKVGGEGELSWYPNAGRSILGESAGKQGLEIDPHTSMLPNQVLFVLLRVCVPEFEDHCSKDC